MSRAWMRYTMQERYQYEMEIKRLKAAIVAVCGISMVIGFFIGRMF